MKTSFKVALALVVLTVVLSVGATALLTLSPLASAAVGPPAAGSGAGDLSSWGLMAAALATAVAAAGAGFAVGKVGTAAIGALAEKPELFGRLLIFVGLAEGIAIYGLIVSILILNRLA
jgi:V/A-type H+-transporting ATPase subunit K